MKAKPKARSNLYISFITAVPFTTLQFDFNFCLVCFSMVSLFQLHQFPIVISSTTQHSYQILAIIASAFSEYHLQPTYQQHQHQAAPTPEVQFYEAEQHFYCSLGNTESSDQRGLFRKSNIELIVE